jgi:transcriptional regulator with XRE-family HTH domain
MENDLEPTIGITELIGKNARRLRTEAGVTLDDLALAARHYDLHWTTGRVGSFESGRFSPTVDVLYAAAAALGDVIGRKVSIWELFGADHLMDPTMRVFINDKLTIPAASVLGDVAAIPPTQARLLGMEPIPRESYVRAMFREADERMCKALRVDYDTGAAAMSKLWGRTFVDERKRRTEVGANAQRKGIIARRLKAELVEELGSRRLKALLDEQLGTDGNN